MSTTLAPNPDQIEATAEAILATPGDYPGDDEGLSWATMIAQVALTAAQPAVTTTKDLEALGFRAVISDGRLPMVKGNRGDWHQTGNTGVLSSNFLAQLLNPGESYTVLRWGGEVSKQTRCDFCEEPIEGKPKCQSTEKDGRVLDFCTATCLIDFINNEDKK